MALTKTDKTEIERIARREIRDFIKKAPFKKDVIDIVLDELKKNNSNLSRAHSKEVVDISTKVMVELYKTFWLRRDFWERQIKNLKP